MDAQRGLSVSGHRNTVLCLHLTSDTYHVTPSGRAPRARGKFWIRRVKLRIFRPDPKSHKSEGFPAAQIFKTHKCQNTYCRSAHFSKAVKFVGAQNPRGTPCPAPGLTVWPARPGRSAPCCLLLPLLGALRCLQPPEPQRASWLLLTRDRCAHPGSLTSAFVPPANIAGV